MKVIGKRVHVIPPVEKNPRNGEGDFVRLPDGRIMFAYSEYYTSDMEDHGPSQITAVFSSDEGESFGDRRVLVAPREDVLNRMCVSFLTMRNGDIGMFYAEKYLTDEGRVYMRYMLTRTKDGEVFSEPMNCAEGIKYSVFENARVIRLSSGRILIPSNDHPYDENNKLKLRGIAEFFYSDDDGKTFHKFSARYENPNTSVSSGLQETGVIEIEGEKILAFSRTDASCQYLALSEDGGETFTTPQPSLFFTSPCSPMHMRHLPNGKTIAVWNPCPPTPLTDVRHNFTRTPLACAVVDGKGEKFLGDLLTVPAKVFLLEDDLKEAYCYPAVFAEKDYFLCAYYHSYGQKFILSATVIKKIYYSEIEE